jgi:hypothetical protein
MGGNMIPNTDPKTGIRYGVISLHDLDPYFAYEEFYDNSENLAIKEVELEIDELFNPIKEFAKERGLDKETEIEKLKESIAEEMFENWDESEDSRIYEHDGYKIQLIDNDLFIAKSPYVTFGPLCSPCAPNAVYLADADGENGYMTYCLPSDFFPDGKAPYKYITVDEVYNRTWKALYPDDKMPELIQEMNDLKKFIDEQLAIETNQDILHWIRNLRTNVILLIEALFADPDRDRIKFYLTSVRMQIGMVNEMKRRVEDENY